LLLVDTGHEPEDMETGNKLCRFFSALGFDIIAIYMHSNTASEWHFLINLLFNKGPMTVAATGYYLP